MQYREKQMISNLLILLIKLKVVIVKFVLKPVWWILWDFLGFHLIFNKIFPLSNEITSASDYKRPPSFGIWLFSIYFAFLGFTTARYERILDRAEFKYNTLTTQLAADVPLDSLRVKEIGRFEIPIEPKIEWNWIFFKDWNFIITVWNSLTSNKQFYQTLKFSNEDLDGDVETKEAKTNEEFLIKMVELWKHKLVRAYLQGANLQEVNLQGVNLQGVNLEGANLQGANLEEASLRKANLQGASLSKANLVWANLEGADLFEALFGYTKDAIIDRLSSVYTLYEATGLPTDIERELKHNHRELFEDPRFR